MDQDRVTLFKTAERIKEELIKASRVLPQDVQALIDKVNPEGGKAESVFCGRKDALRRHAPSGAGAAGKGAQGGRGRALPGFKGGSREIPDRKLYVRGGTYAVGARLCETPSAFLEPE